MIGNSPAGKKQHSVGRHGIQEKGDPVERTQLLPLIPVLILQAFDEIALAASKYL
jgi:hypothetical protein